MEKQIDIEVAQLNSLAEKTYAFLYDLIDKMDKTDDEKILIQYFSAKKLFEAVEKGIKESGYEILDVKKMKVQ